MECLLLYPFKSKKYVGTSETHRFNVIRVEMKEKSREKI